MAEPKPSFVERLFAEHAGALQAFFRRRIQTEADAQDLAQEVYLRMLRQIATRLSDVLRALGTGVALALCTAPAAQAVTDAPAALSAGIPEQPLAQALEAFAQQTGLHLVYVSRLVRNQKSHAVAAGLRADEALARLLQGTGLKFEFLTAHSVRILADMRPPAAQSPPAPSEESQPLLPVVLVTGSRIPVPANVTATSPLQVVTSQDIALAGHADSVDVISTLPQMITSGADMSNYSSPAATSVGIATADLRGLGPQRTIVLINGRRLGLGDPNTSNQSPAPDLDQIPLQMVDRVEVLTGGASATYGSDAVAGVVNFILKDHVQGVQISGQYGFAQHTQQDRYIQGVQSASGITPPTGTVIDGFRRDLSVLAGTSFHDNAATAQRPRQALPTHNVRFRGRRRAAALRSCGLRWQPSSGPFLTAKPFQEACIRKSSTAGGEIRISLNACIQLPVFSSDPIPRSRNLSNCSRLCSSTSNCSEAPS